MIRYTTCTIGYLQRSIGRNIAAYNIISFDQDTRSTIDYAVRKTIRFDVIDDALVFRARLKPKSRDGDLFGLFQD